MTVESPNIIFASVVDRESLYDQGTVILGFPDESLTEQQLDFKHCYDLWLGLGNGFFDVCNGTWVTSLPRGIAVFERFGPNLVAEAGSRVLAEFSSRGICITGDGISCTADDTSINELFENIRKIDTEYIERIWDSDLEDTLIRLAAEAIQ